MRYVFNFVPFKNFKSNRDQAYNNLMYLSRRIKYFAQTMALKTVISVLFYIYPNEPVFHLLESLISNQLFLFDILILQRFTHLCKCFIKKILKTAHRFES